MYRLALALTTLAVIAAGCSSGKRDAGSCIEVEFQRSATSLQQASFVDRVRRLDGVVQIERVSRQQHIERFVRQLRATGYSGDRLAKFTKRAQSHAGAMLLIRPRALVDMERVVRALETLPAYVSRVTEGLPCGRPSG